MLITIINISKLKIYQININIYFFLNGDLDEKSRNVYIARSIMKL